jgi:hypothetical protein
MDWLSNFNNLLGFSVSTDIADTTAVPIGTSASLVVSGTAGNGHLNYNNICKKSIKAIGSALNIAVGFITSATITKGYFFPQAYWSSAVWATDDTQNNLRSWQGFFNATPPNSANLGSVSGVGIRFNPADGDTTYQLVSCNGSAPQTVVDTGVTPSPFGEGDCISLLYESGEYGAVPTASINGSTPVSVTGLPNPGTTLYWALQTWVTEGTANPVAYFASMYMTDS